MTETTTYRVLFTSTDAPDEGDPFYRYCGEHLPDEGDVIAVTRFVRGRVTRARVTRVDANTSPPIAATQVD